MAVNLSGEGAAEAGSKNNLIDFEAESGEEGKAKGNTATDSIEDTVEADEEERRSRENADRHK